MRRRLLTLGLGVVPPLLLLCAGIWLGGHPRWLPDPVADLLTPQDTRLVAEALDEIESSDHREVDDGKLADAAVKGAVASLGDRFSAYFTPQEYDAFQDATKQPLLRGRARDPRRAPRPARGDRLRRLAGRPRGHPCRRRDRRRERASAGRPPGAGGDGADQGPGGNQGDPARAAREPDADQDAHARHDLDPRRGDRVRARRRAPRGTHRAGHVQLRSARRARRGDPPRARPGRPRDRVRPARQRRRPGARGAARWPARSSRTA